MCSDLSVDISMLIYVLLGFNLASIVSLDTKAKCPVGYRKYNQRCLRLFGETSDQSTWMEARDRCLLDGGDLAFVEDKATQNFVSNVLAKNQDVEEAWFGLNDREKEGLYKYPNGQWNFFNGAWSNNQGPLGNTTTDIDDCVMIVLPQKHKNWYDEPCHMKYNFLCEWPKRANVYYGRDTTTQPTPNGKITTPDGPASIVTTAVTTYETTAHNSNFATTATTSFRSTTFETTTVETSKYSNISSTDFTPTIVATLPQGTIANQTLSTPKPGVQSCSERVTSDGKVWRKTAIGQYGSASCEDDHVGMIERECGFDGTWRDASYMSCVMKGLNGVMLKVKQNRTTLTASDAHRYAQETYTIITNTSNVWYPGDIVAVKTIMEDLVDSLASNDNTTDFCYTFLHFGQLLVDIASIILDGQLEDDWLEVQKNGSNVMEMSTIIDEIGFLTTPCSEGDGSSHTTRMVADNLNLTAVIISNGANAGFTNIDKTVHLKRDVFKSSGGRGGAIVMVNYKTLHSLNPKKEVNRNGEIFTINSQITSATIRPAMEHDVTDSVVIVIPHIKTANMSHPLCSFWNFTAQSTNSTPWSTQGCRLGRVNSTHTECLCSHLTNFAILMQTVEFEISDTDQVALSIITYIGCGLSISGLLCTFIVLLSLGDFRNERNNILLNLTAAMLLAQISFLLGTHQTHDKVLCKVVAVCLHFLFLTTFMWMFVEAIQLWLKVVCVFASRDKTKYFITVGWGVPFIITGISVAFKFNGYGGPKYCWLQITDGFIWAFTGPALVIIVANFIVLVVVLKSYMSLKATTKKTRFKKVGSAIRAAMVLFPILGTAWVFGFFAVDRNTVAFQYVFAIINTLQGLMIFGFHCVGNEEVKNKYIKRRRHKPSFEAFHNRIFPGSVRSRSRSHDSNRQDTKSFRKDSIPQALPKPPPNERQEDYTHHKDIVDHCSPSAVYMNQSFIDDPMPSTSKQQSLPSTSGQQSLPSASGH